jgi:PPOX class probable F420-dependent enzyme
MTAPRAERPDMPGYGVLPADQGSGLMPWAEAERRLTAAHDYWCATVRSDGRPHVMPVWGIWLARRLWFSSGVRSRKARNLAADPRCVLTTDDARNPVVVEGSADRVVEPGPLARFLAAVNDKYAAGLEPDFLDPAVNATFAVRPDQVIALTVEDFPGSPTRWTFPPG